MKVEYSLLLYAIQFRCCVFHRQFFTPLQKPNSISVLNLIPFTGEEPAKGEACRLASQIVADAINARGDILPSYHIEMDFEDEFVGRWAAMQVVQFADKFTKRSPVMIGPQYSTGCKAISPILPHLNMVALSTWCTAPILEDHIRFSNLYLNQGTGISRAFAILRFIHDFGHWNRFAIVTNAENINDYGTALFLNDAAHQNGFNVAWFAMVPDGVVDEATMVTLKETGVRIVVIATCFPELMTSVLCEAYRQGMFGPRYVFIADTDTNLDPLQLEDVIYPGCTKAIVLQQLKLTFWIGGMVVPMEEDRERISLLGYTWPQFEIMMDELTNSTPPGDAQSRYVCHDGTLKALMALDATEKKLNMLNLTLKDYDQNPSLVMELANEATPHINVVGLLRSNTYNTNKAPSNLEVVVHWSPEKGNKNVANVDQVLQSNGSDISFSSFECRPTKDQIEDSALVDWIVPRDSPKLVKPFKEIPCEIFVIVLVLAAILAMCQFICLYLTLKWSNIFPRGKSLTYVGCILVEVASVLLARGTSSATAIATLVLGTSLTHFAIVMRIVSMLKASQYTNMRPVRKKSAKSESGRRQLRALDVQLSVLSSPRLRRISPTGMAEESFSSSKVREIPQKYWKQFDKITIKTTSLYLVINGIMLACFLSLTKTIKCNLVMLEAVYLDDSDTIVETWLIKCGLPDTLIDYLLFVVFLHLLFFPIGMISAYKLSHIRMVIYELAYLRIGLINHFTIFLLATTLVAIIPNPIIQNITISFACLCCAAISTSICIVPTIVKRIADK